ncbi:MAG: MaoC family dehydratase N-terminal domain-containing protein, partial [Rhodospirillaceae bacterium]|nr:MaoC family dehydratase N-terminal domain-containing protein [Rhodospirillaceae bacterium]
RPLRIGRAVTRISEITDVAMKEGRTGPLAFVTVRHAIADDDGDCVVEEQNLVYRDPPRPGDAAAPEQPPAESDFHRIVTPDPVMLFRFSALTFNGHRIHYDQPYATAVEGYAGLVVHGPLLAILLLDLVRRERPGAVLSGFSFRAFRPVFDTSPFRIAGRADGGRVALWAEDNGGALAMRAEATIG